MKIIMTIWALDIWAGSQTWFWTVCRSLREMGHEVDIWSPKPGSVSDSLGGITDGKGRYDLAITSHIETLGWVRRECQAAQIVHILHGPTDGREQPVDGADVYMAVSPEVARRSAGLGYRTELVAQPIDLDHFRCDTEPRDTLRNVGLMTHHRSAIDVVSAACERLAVRFEHIGGTRAVPDVRKWVESQDIVVTVGRGALEVAAIGRQVVIFDHRKYGEAQGDGLLTPAIYERSARCNFSGRGIGLVRTVDDVAHQLERYDADEARAMRPLLNANHDAAAVARHILSTASKAVGA